MSKQVKYYPTLKSFDNTDAINTYEDSAPWPKANTSFYWMNFEYPLIHNHTDWELLIVLKDSIVHIIDGTTATLHAGDACLIGPMNEHALFYPNDTKNQFQGISILAKDSYMRELFNLFSPSLYNDVTTGKNPLYFSLSDSFIESLDNKFFEIQTLQHRHRKDCERRCNILFHSIIVKFLSNESKSASIPPSILTFVKRLNNPALTSEDIKQMQEDLPYSYPQLAKLFKKYTGFTITQYVNKVKLEYAKELLATTNLTTLSISSKLHFDSLSHFNHLFKREFNMTPSQYRKQKK